MIKSIYDYNNEKNLKLLKERGIGFEEIICILDTKEFLAVIDHPNPRKYLNQKIYIVDVDGYAYLVPFEKSNNKCVLKTIYPSRKITRLYREKLLRGELK
jgi:hypothetical protein